MTPDQIRASHPTTSVFVSASAGSGKTTVLINRLLRLMLPHKDKQGCFHRGCSPDRILCLTFTNAAATEMTTRLQKELGQWATFSDDQLNKKLEALEIPLSPETRNKARSLFTEVLDLPGGMRINTIHAFCQSLLKRFPIEAHLSPHFTLLDENNADITYVLQQCIEDTLGHVPKDIIEPLTNKITLGTFTKLVLSLCRDIKAQPVLELANTHPNNITHILCDAFNISNPETTDDAILEQACRTVQEEALRQSFEKIKQGTNTARECVPRLIEWLNLPLSERKAQWEDVWCEKLLTKEGNLKKNLISTKLEKECPDVVDTITKEAQHISDVRKQIRIRRLLTFSESFIRSIAPIAQRYNNQKTSQGQLEYDDLIRHTLHLLKHVETSWILYKLDSKIDHILVDEAQDTSPEQWKIIQHLTNEFFAGIGARSEETPHRTIFAVGDYKQSIYSFQGAEPQAFKDWQNHFHQRVKNAQLSWDTPKLETSFRSAPIVLKFVDTVFSFPEAAQGVVREEQDIIQHEASPDWQKPSNQEKHIEPRIELWDLISSDDNTKDKEINPWNLDKGASSQRPDKTAEQKLADALADYIQQLTQPFQSHSPSLKPQDILILVRKRSPFVGCLSYALKVRHIPVTNLTRARLIDQIAVQDLMTLCEALLLPQDDLTLACVLTSPLGGLSDKSLMRLALDRPDNQDLWSTLKERHSQEEDWTRAWNFLDTLFSKVDYLSPYALLSLALGFLGGRPRLLARLGQSAIEPIDELLTTALQYQDKNPPSLQGFIYWLKNSQKEIKYRTDTEGESVRIMTVHSAKGLEAPLVILPDTMSTPDSNKRDTLRWLSCPDHSLETNELKIPVYASKDEATLLPKIQKVIDTKKIKEQEEYNRLLYVALTRARDRLVICGFNSKKKKTEVSDTSWYDHCKRAFQKLDAQRQIGFNGIPDFYVLEENNISQKNNPEHHLTQIPPLPTWVGHAPDWKPTPPKQEESSLHTLTPSRSESDSSASSAYARSPLEIATITPVRARAAALRRGTLVHELLQFLPNLPIDQQEGVARQYLERPIHGFDHDTARSLAKNLISVIRMPELAPLFTQKGKAEQPLAGIVNGRVIVGQVDRLCILPDRVIVCDFKTGRHIPRDVYKTPVDYLRQMAAYRTLLQQLWPHKTIDCVLVWVDEPRADILPETLLETYSLSITSSLSA
ncbi:MAG: double-strand break repair helicase AddA [Acetobacter sp.]|nr:double-strand break repair helicase AddA [Acetobacter sp.]